MTALLLSVLLLSSYLTVPAEAALQQRTLNLMQIQNMAVAHSTDISKQNSKIILKKMKYVEAVEGIRAKVKNLRSFRWTPLLSFKFPQQLKIKEEYDLNVKPLTILSEIDVLKHQLDDLKFKAIYTANKQYFEAYTLQESVAFTETRLENARQDLKRNKGQLLTGNATQADVDKAQSSVDQLTKKLTNMMKDYEKAKTALSDTIGLDISVGYRLKENFIQANIPRSALDSLIQYTLDHDQGYYEAKATTATAHLNLDFYERLMRNQYGWKMDPIQNYINMARNGMDVDYGAFQIQYKNMLKRLDQPWKGNFWILFFKFPKEWFKGEIAGTRYIEDEMYAVYTACMEYANAVRDQANLKKQLTGQVKDNFDTVVSNYVTYVALQDSAKRAEKTLERLKLLNRTGKATYPEVADALTAYEDAQQDAIDSLKDYSISLSEFDRLTCGAVSVYLTGAGAGLEAGEGGDAFAVLDPIGDPYYYIYASVADMTFNIGVSIPEGFAPSIDSFEVWYGGIQIGERTTVGSELRHLTLDYRDTNLLVLRFYNGENFVDECEINAVIPRDVLPIEAEEPAAEKPRVVGSYSTATSLRGGVSVSELKLKVHAAEKAKFYSLRYGEQDIYSTEKHPLEESFHYLTILTDTLDGVTAQLYDKEENHLMDVRFNPETQELITIPAEN